MDDNYLSLRSRSTLLDDYMKEITQTRMQIAALLNRQQFSVSFLLPPYENVGAIDTQNLNMFGTYGEELNKCIGNLQTQLDWYENLRQHFENAVAGFYLPAFILIDSIQDIVLLKRLMARYPATSFYVATVENLVTTKMHVFQQLFEVFKNDFGALLNQKYLFVLEPAYRGFQGRMASFEEWQLRGFHRDLSVGYLDHFQLLEAQLAEP